MLGKKNSRVYENYAFLGNKIVESCKKENITDIKIDTEKNKVNIFYKNENIKTEISDNLTKYDEEWSPLLISILSSFDIKKNGFGRAIIILLILGFIFIPNIIAPALIIFFILGIFGLGVIPLAIIVILVILYFIIEQIILYILRSFVQLLSKVSLKFFKEDYIGILFFKLAYIYNIEFIQKLWVRYITNYRFDTRISYVKDFLYPSYLINLDKIKIMNIRDNKKISLEKDIELITKHKIGKEIFKLNYILDKFYDIYDNIYEKTKGTLNIINNIVNQKIEYELNIKNPKIENLKKKYIEYLNEIKELDKISNTLRSLYSGAKDLNIINEIDDLLVGLNKDIKRLDIINKELHNYYNKQNQLDNIKIEIDKNKQLKFLKYIINLYQKYFNILVFFYKRNSSNYLKNKIIEINTEINNLIEDFNNEIRIIKENIMNEQKGYEDKINILLDESKELWNKINNSQNRIKEIRDNLNNNIK